MIYGSIRWVEFYRVVRWFLCTFFYLNIPCCGAASSRPYVRLCLHLHRIRIRKRREHLSHGVVICEQALRIGRCLHAIHSVIDNGGITFVTCRDLFNAAFVSCWTELNPPQQEELTRALEQALVSQNVAEVTHTLLNLAEFMEHCDRVRRLVATSERLAFLASIKCLAFVLWLPPIRSHRSRVSRGGKIASAECCLAVVLAS